MLKCRHRRGVGSLSLAFCEPKGKTQEREGYSTKVLCKNLSEVRRKEGWKAA